jgi:hypothetical protein
MRQFKPPKMLREPLQVASNEVYLFHGTPETICDAVLREGFDSRLGSGLFGQGSYFAESASKSDQYVATSTHIDCSGFTTFVLQRATCGSPADCLVVLLILM